ncbi:MAG TPA: hypothetical protein PK950_00435 [Candidatus Paceibacterota bacterium]|nr:hypothetical protein [Candidatus Paceibacterota bacterium]
MKKIPFETFFIAASCLFVLACAFAAMPLPASAHVLKTDGTMGAILHIDPNDSPVAGEPASIFFDLKDSANIFAVENCVCVVSVLQSGESILEKTVTRIAPVTYTFPERSIYTVQFSGTPKAGEGAATFEPFVLSYDIRVDTVSAADPKQAAIEKEAQNFFQKHWTHIILFGGAIIFAIFSMIRESLKKKV